MTPDLDALRALLEKATPGPWRKRMEEPYEMDIASRDRSIVKVWLDDAPVEDYNETQHANATLIVAAVNTLPALLDALQGAREDARRPSNWVWQHVKTGGEYEILHEGMIEADCSPVVIYRSLAPTNEAVWVRPQAEFNERFKRLRPIDAARKGET